MTEEAKTLTEDEAKALLEEKSRQHGAKVCTTDGKLPTTAEGGAPKPIEPATGQHGAYYVLCEDERKKGFVRPVRQTYVHVGSRPKFETRPLTDVEKETARYGEDPYVAFEPYPEGYKGSATGRFWSAKQLTSGCGSKTTMGTALAETYARKPSFYGSTFCVRCGTHFPVGENGEFEWEDGSKVGT